MFAYVQISHPHARWVVERFVNIIYVRVLLFNAFQAYKFCWPVVWSCDIEYFPGKQKWNSTDARKIFQIYGKLRISVNDDKIALKFCV